MCKGLLCFCYAEISLKKGRVTGSLHTSDFADTIFLKRLIFRLAEQKLRAVITAACTQFSRERKSHPAGQNYLRLCSCARTTCGTRADGCGLTMIDLELEIK